MRESPQWCSRGIATVMWCHGPHPIRVTYSMHPDRRSRRIPTVDTSGSPMTLSEATVGSGGESR